MGEVTITGIEDVSWPRGKYFDVFKGVKAYDEEAKDVTSSLKVLGNVNYGKEGTYSLTYKVGEVTRTRTVTIAEGSLSEEARSRVYGEDTSVTLGSGSYREGGSSITTATLVDGDEGPYYEQRSLGRASEATYIANDLFNDGALPSNNWYSGFMRENFGGATRACTNPYYVKASGSGFAFGARSKSWTQNFDVNKDTISGLGTLTMENFHSTYDDLTIYTSSLSSVSRSEMLSYDKLSCSISMQDSSGEDLLVSNLVQGAIFSSFYTSGDDFIIDLIPNVRDRAVFYKVDGTQIDTSSSISIDQLVISFPSIHIGYQSVAAPSTALGAPLYLEVNYLVSAPKGSSFSFSQGSHADPLSTGRVSVSLGEGNYLTVASLPSLSDASSYANYAYSVFQKGEDVYDVDHTNSEVTTTFKYSRQNLDGNDKSALVGLLPHQWKNSSVSSLYEMNTIRGKMKITEGDSFSMSLPFKGVLPFLPFSGDTSTLSTYLDDLISRTSDTSIYDSDKKNYISAPGPYWASKALYPLSIGMMLANQAGLTSQLSQIKTLLKDALTDFFTYSGTDDTRYLYYDEVNTAMIYSSDDFSVGSRLSDHHFTHGYLVYASSALMSLDSEWKENYGDITKELLYDYMNPYKDETRYPYFRTYDPYAGHSWADGLGNFGDGNDQESSGEALNSAVAAYFLGSVLGDQDIIDAAIYVYTNELNALKQYIFNYDGDNWDSSLSNSTHAIGILWGSKNSYSTWFGPNPEFIYGIHYLPIGEYLTSYGLTASERTTLSEIYGDLVDKLGTSPRLWKGNFLCIQSVYTSGLTFSASELTSDEYPNDLALVYGHLSSMENLGVRSDSYPSMTNGVMASVYEQDGNNKIAYYNLLDKEATVTIDGKTVSLPANTNSISDI